MNTNLEIILENFKTYLKKQGKSQNTVLSYLCSVRLYYSMYSSASIEYLQEYRNTLLSKFRANTVNTRIYGINCFLDFLAAESRAEHIPAFPAHINKEAFPPAEPVSLPPSPLSQGSLEDFRLDPVKLSDRKGALPDRSSLSRQWGRDSGIESDVLAMFSDSQDNYRLNPVKKQQTTYLDSVISQRDYEKFKRHLKKDGNLYWYFVVRFLGATGARISELLQIKLEDLKLGHLDLYSKGGKVRRLYFPKKLCDESIPWFESKGIRSGFIFLNQHGRPITSRGISSQLKSLAVRYRIDPDTIYPHSFRHRFAKNFLKKFNDISLLADLLGHDSIETTRIYLTRSSAEQKELLDRIITW